LGPACFPRAQPVHPSVHFPISPLDAHPNLIRARFQSRPVLRVLACILSSDVDTRPHWVRLHKNLMREVACEGLRLFCPNRKCRVLREVRISKLDAMLADRDPDGLSLRVGCPVHEHVALRSGSER
jgi:hypothetical protein